jgi:hypothetical protein
VFFESRQLVVSLLAIALSGGVATALVFWRAGERRLARRWGTFVLFACALTALFAWTRFGSRHTVYVDAAGEEPSDPHRKKVAQHLNFHFSEFFHYYLGAKYFPEVGYEGLYDCTALGDSETAEEDHVRPRIGGWVRDLDDVLTDKTYTSALAHCRDELKPRFTPQRWSAFKGDIRELRRLVGDDMWPGLVYDAGFNPPPSWVLLGCAVANAIPIRLAGTSSFLFATGLDLALLFACAFALRWAFNAPVAAIAAVFFGATFIASYGWNGGAFLRYTWLTTLVVGLCALKRGRWVLAGAFLGASACDRVFPAGFAFGAMIPVAWGAIRLHSVEDRRRLLRFGAGFGATVLTLVAVSLVVFGTESWRVFVHRIGRHGDVYFVMHIGLKKVLTWRDWVPNQNFHGHLGLRAFHDWNLRLRETWGHMRLLAIPLQLAAAGGAAYAGLRRRPYESALLFGVVAMFFFSLPANYYYVVLALVPALLLNAAMTAPSRPRRQRDYGVFVAFLAFWVMTLLAPRIWDDGIVYDYVICLGLAIFLGVWIVIWGDHTRSLLRRIAAPPARAGKALPPLADSARG